MTQSLEQANKEGKDSKEDPEENSDPVFDDEDVSEEAAYGGDNRDAEGPRNELQEVQKLAQRETDRIKVLRTVVLILIFVTAVVVSLGTFLLLNRLQHDDFRKSFALFANTVTDALEFYLTSFQDAVEGSSVALSSTAKAQNQQFPFVTIPSFESLCRWARFQTGMETIIFAPYVLPHQLQPWGNYSATNAQQWITASREMLAVDPATDSTVFNTFYQNDTVRAFVIGSIEVSSGVFIEEYELASSFRNMTPDDADLFAPEWMYSPPPFANGVINYDSNTYNPIVPTLTPLRNLRLGLHTPVYNVQHFDYVSWTPEAHLAFHQNLVNFSQTNNNNNNAENKQTSTSAESIYNHPHSAFVWPVFEIPNDQTSRIAGHFYGLLPWDRFLVRLLPEGVRGIQVVLRNTCNQSYTYNLDGNGAFYQGDGDFHDTSYDNLETIMDFYDHGDRESEVSKASGHCLYSFHIYPTKEFESEYKTALPEVLAGVVGFTFFFMVLTFLAYDRYVRTRNQKVLIAAATSNAIVSSMFPSQIRDKLLADKHAVRAIQKSSKLQGDAFEEKAAIAEFYPETTIMFADIVGFTAWSSVREPEHVFQLLESLYAKFDEVAKKRRIFKVETVGDCYVAVTGLPNPRSDHAVAMARFARECLQQMNLVLKQLEVRLGPETGDLDMRVGLHSGSVTAGVLRGDRARFQLFGDTMNTASRMESTGKPGKIQVSQETANLLKDAGKMNWLAPREDMITAKGKGLMVTFWLVGSLRTMQHDSTDSSDSGTALTGGLSESLITESNTELQHTSSAKDLKAAREKTSRSVEWMATIMQDIICKINPSIEQLTVRMEAPIATGGFSSGTVLDQVVDVIPISHGTQSSRDDAITQTLGPEAVLQLKQFLNTVASLYGDLPFHNFEHATHVVLTSVKLLHAIDQHQIMNTTCCGSYGISHDPVAQLACIFAAVIHDADHPGVSNAVLLAENSHLSCVYKKSIAEQNSFDVTWTLFLEDRFAALREAMFHGNGKELGRFRQLVINLVMATDILDEDHHQTRVARWRRTFANQDDESAELSDQRATLILESLIQAADISHTMQHWHIFRKWNQRLFDEMYWAYSDGRSEANPAEYWFEGELQFFDIYVIPLAKNLSESKIFGARSGELVEYALKNRQEWEERGRDIVAEYVFRVQIENGRPKKTVDVEKSS